MNSCNHCPPLLFEGLPASEQERLRALCAFACEHLGGLYRRSGESYAEHGCEVAAVLRENCRDASLLAAAILHDIVVHPQGAELLSRAPLRADERELVLVMYSLRRLHIDENTRDLDRVISAFTEDTRLLPLRMAHRLNDVRHLERFLPTLRKRIARETLHMYTAIAGRLGMHQWRYEMEDTCFAVVHPQACAHLRRKYEDMRSLDLMCMKHTQEFLLRNFRAEKIPCRIDQRIKGLYSTYRKMSIKRCRYDDLTDRLALRITVQDVMDCYRALAVVHACMHPIPGKLKDYIGAPKENGYQSIHTVVYPLPGVTEQPIEIQIRTEEMHRICENGPSSHAEYKSLMYALSARPARVHLFRNLQSLREEMRSPKQFEKALRMYFREDHVAVFDNENNLYHFKKPVTALDFVCRVHPKRCLKLKAVRINGRSMPMDTHLHDGDIVEAQFAREIQARPHWQDSCCHGATKAQIRECAPVR